MWEITTHSRNRYKAHRDFLGRISKIEQDLLDFPLLEVVELEADRVGAGALETIHNPGDFAVRDTARRFNKNRLLNSQAVRKIRAR
jgi:hypothetical protein